MFKIRCFNLQWIAGFVNNTIRRRKKRTISKHSMKPTAYWLNTPWKFACTAPCYYLLKNGWNRPSKSEHYFLTTCFYRETFCHECVFLLYIYARQTQGELSMIIRDTFLTSFPPSSDVYFLQISQMHPFYWHPEAHKPTRDISILSWSKHAPLHITFVVSCMY